MTDTEPSEPTAGSPIKPPITFKKRSTQIARKRVATPPRRQSISDPDNSSSEGDRLHVSKKQRKTVSLAKSSSRSSAAPKTDSSSFAHSSNPAHGDASSTLSKTAVGPVKAPTHIRTVIITDFQPDVCKDYKNTGFCGFGDSCKFLHAREDYKQGWQLDQEWELMKGKSGRGDGAKSKVEQSQDQDEKPPDIPFVCMICKGPYRKPVVTSCSHYFCESCALQRYRKDPTCATCGLDSGGVFNAARKLLKK